MSDWTWNEKPRPELWPHSDLPVREHELANSDQTFITDGDYDGELASYYPWRLVNGYPSAVLGSYSRLKAGRPRTLYAHILLTPPKPPGMWVSFVNGNHLDCRSANLEFITPSISAAKRQIGNGIKGSAPSGYVGVIDRSVNRPSYLQNPSWKRYKVVLPSAHFYQYFHTAEEAARAYDREALKKYGKYAQLNFPREHLDK